MVFDTEAFEKMLRAIVREEMTAHNNQEFAGYAEVDQFIGISGISKRDMEEKVIPHPAFRHCVRRFDGGRKRYIHIKEGLAALNQILREEVR